MSQFVKAPVELLMDRNLQNRDIRIYLVLRLHRQEKKKSEVHVSRQTMARKLMCSLDTIDRAIKRLVKHGYIFYRKGCKGIANTYHFKDESEDGDSRTSAATMAAEGSADGRNNSKNVAAQMRPQSELGDQSYIPEHCFRLFHGKDIAFIAVDGSIRIRNHAGQWVGYGGGDEEPFRFMHLCGTEARKAALAHFNGASLQCVTSGTVSSSTDVEATEPNRPQAAAH